jgi:elongator complex protein 1
MVNTVCDKVREELERVDLIRFTNAVLTARVVKSPPEHEEALRLLLRLRGKNFLIKLEQ